MGASTTNEDWRHAERSMKRQAIAVSATGVRYRFELWSWPVLMEKAMRSFYLRPMLPGDERVAAVLARACIGEHLARHHAQPKSVVEFAVGQQPGIRGDNGAAKLQRQAAVEIEPNSIRY